MIIANNFISLMAVLRPTILSVFFLKDVRQAR